MTEWGPVSRPDAATSAECARRRDLLPQPALGTFGPALDRLAAARGTAHGPADPLTPARPVLAVFAGDHGIAYAGVTPYPPGTTARRIRDLADGRGPIAILAAEADVTVRAFDIAVRDDLSDSAVIREHRIRAACGRIDMQPALREDEIEECFAAGRAIADAEIDSGADLLIGAVCGAAISTPVAALVSALTGTEPALTTTRGSGIDDAMWIAKCAAVRDARFLARGQLGDAQALLQTLGGPDLAVLTAFIIQGATRRTPVLVDDAASAVCALVAQRLVPGVADYVTAADTTMDRTEDQIHRLLRIEPLSDHRLTLGSGAGALLAVPALRAAMRVLDGAGTDGPTTARGEHAAAAWDRQLL